MTQTVSGAVARRKSGAEEQIRAYRTDFATVLPTHLRADTWVRVAQGLLRKDAKLRKVAEANVGSFMAALLDCARWGLEPGVTYHLVPFGAEVVGIRDYKGIIELMYRAGAVSSVKAEIVHAGDWYDYDPESMRPPMHKPAGATDGRSNWFASREQRGEMVGAYAYAIMKDGSVSQVVNMAEWEILEHKAASKTAHQPDSMWQKWPRSAWKKTVARELEKWVPSSPEWITEKLRAERLDQQPDRPLSPAALALPPPVVDDEVLDGEVVAPEPSEQQREQITTRSGAAARSVREAADDAAEKKDKDRLFALLRDGAVSSRDKELRLRIAARILNWPPADPLTSFEQLKAGHVATINNFLQRHKDAGDLTHTLNELGAVAPVETPPEATPAEQPEQAADTEGDQQ